jgi:hypothetical protein
MRHLLIFLCAVAWAQLPALAPGDFTVVGVPDPQYLALGTAQGVFYAGLVDWIRSNSTVLNIQAVIVYGDLVDTTWTPGSDYGSSQETIAWSALSQLDAVPATPWIVAAGNHDYVNGANTLAGWPIGEAWKDSGAYASAPNSVVYPGYWSAARFLEKGQSWWASSSQFHTSPTTNAANLNRYMRLQIGGVKLLIISLECFPPADSVAWATSVMAGNPDYMTILVTHVEINRGALTTNEKAYYGLTYTNASDGIELWPLLVSSPNLVLVLSGHEDASLWSKLALVSNDGHTVYHMQTDMQIIDSDGPGWIWGTSEKAYLHLFVFRASGCIDNYILSTSTGHYIIGNSAGSPLVVLPWHSPGPSELQGASLFGAEFH